MGIFYSLPDYDRDIASLEKPPIILNDIESEVCNLIDPVKELTTTEYDSEVISTLPRCTCGMTHGRYNTTSDPDTANTVCVNCGDEVMSPIERGFKSTVWMRVPQGVSAFIRTNVLNMLLDCFNQSEFNAIEYLCDRKYEPKKTSVTFERFKKLDIPRGYNHFVDNFDRVMKTLEESPVFKPNEKRIELFRFIKQFRHLIFSQYMPLPSRRSIITELSNNSHTCAKGYVNVVDAARAIYSTVMKKEVRHQIAREQNTFKAMVMLVKYQDYVDREILGSKPGWYRKQVFGSRTGPSYRGVITSISGEHDYEGIELPRGIGIAVYHTHLIGMLLREGMTLAAAERYIISSISQDDAYMNSLLRRLIKNSPYSTAQGNQGLPNTLGRNPILDDRSIQCLFVTKFKTDPKDNTIGISLLILKSYNADKTFNYIVLLFSNEWELVLEIAGNP